VSASHFETDAEEDESYAGDYGDDPDGGGVDS